MTSTRYDLRWTALVLAFLFLLAGLNPTAAATSKGTASKTKAQPARKSSSIARNPYVGAIVTDVASGRVLVEDNADAHGYPASMLKLMDLLIILEKVKANELSLQDSVKVSARAALTGGSQVWLAQGETFTVEDMLFALMIQSANDAAVALAEKVGGTYENFVEMMNARARQLGMRNTRFSSPHGLPPSAGQPFDVTTARDFSILCRELLKHPEALRYTSTRERAFRPNVPGKTVIMRSHNHLLKSVEGCDGLKTGFINAAGYSIAVTAYRNGQRVITVVLDSVDRKLRDAKASELVARGFTALNNSTPTAAAGPAARALAAPKR
ncbi:MAG TPA: D-alanyl-D-alanine carboxypeptidase family protein [Clostridia bacterium]|nr:D-alanyl-D-alanine carboxypeptidase family protein [Clostridia bacterium]